MCLFLLILFLAAACANNPEAATVERGALGGNPTLPPAGEASLEIVTPMIFVTPAEQADDTEPVEAEPSPEPTTELAVDVVTVEAEAAPESEPEEEVLPTATPPSLLDFVSTAEPLPTIGPEKPEEPVDPVSLTWRMRSATESEVAIYEDVSREIDANSAELELQFQVKALNYAGDLQQEILGGGGPDVFWLSGSQIGDFVSRGLIYDLRPFANDSAEFDDEDYFPGPMAHLTRDPDTGKSGDHLWGVPRDVSTLVLYLNRDLLDASGADDPRQLALDGNWNWDTFRETAEALNRLGDDVWGYGQYSWWGTHGYWMHAAGGEYWDDAGGCALNSDAVREGLTYEQALYNDGLATPVGSFPDQMFANGELGMYLTGRWATPRMRDEIDFNWDVVELPDGPAGEFNFMFWGAYVVNRLSDNPEAAWQLIEELTSAEVQDRLVASGTTIPASLTPESTANFLAATPPENSMAFLNGILGRNDAESPLWGGNWEKWDSTVINALDRVTEGQLSVDEFAATICAEAGWALGEPSTTFKASR